MDLLYILDKKYIYIKYIIADFRYIYSIFRGKTIYIQYILEKMKKYCKIMKNYIYLVYSGENEKIL